MTSVREAVKRIITPAAPLPAGIYHIQDTSDEAKRHRLHLRLEADGTGILVVDATTVLHLNQTAAEYAFHMVNNESIDHAALSIAKRYRVPRQRAVEDYQDLINRINELINTPDLDPEIYLDFDRQVPYSRRLSAPLRMDCALTYRLPDDADPNWAPLRNVERELSTDEWKAVLDKAWERGIPHVVFTGGEPTLRDDLAELIAHTEANGQVSGLLSDGLRFVDLSYLDTLLQTGLDYMMITLYPENQQAWIALDNLLAADLYLGVHLTITLSNAIDASSIIKRLADMGVKAISLSSPEASLREKLLDIRDEAAHLGLTLIWDLPVPYSKFNPVQIETQEDLLPQGAGHAWIYVEPDGDVLPGQGMYHVLGNFLTDPWEKIWQ